MKKKIAILSLLFTAGTAFSQVKVYEGKETIPTHQRADDVLSPVFYTGRGVQGAAGKMYPYPAQNNLGDNVVDVTYDMVYLENEYIRVTMLPGFGSCHLFDSRKSGKMGFCGRPSAYSNTR